MDKFFETTLRFKTLKLLHLISPLGSCNCNANANALPLMALEMTAALNCMRMVVLGLGDGIDVVDVNADRSGG